MAAKLKGIDVILYERTLIGKDAFNHPLYSESPVTVSNVLVAPTSSTEVVDKLSLTGKKAVYTLAIPKGDQHIWDDRIVEFYGVKWHTIGFATQGIEDLIPLEWNKKVQVEQYG